MKKTVLIALSAVTLYACQKEDKLLARKFIKDQVGRVDMTSEGRVDYRMQLYFDLSSGTMKAWNSRDLWDLALACKKGEPNLFVNPAMLQAVAATGSTDFNAGFNPADFKFEYERASRFYAKGLLSHDFFNGIPEGEVFIIDLGKNLQNQKRGYKLLQILNYEDGNYTLRIANLDHTNQKEVQVNTDDTYNFIFISLNNPEMVQTLEPPKEEWDLYFTKYMERLYGGTDTLDYSVTGCLINPWFTEAYFNESLYQDSTRSYGSISLEDIDESQYTTRQDVIGHDWKYYNLNSGAYQVLNRKVYFVKDSEGTNYRLHFTGFYDDFGNKGTVTFEYLPL